MPKLKTKRKAAKRFRITKNGKVLAKAAGRRHLLGDKAPKRKRQMRTHVTIEGRRIVKNIRTVLPYSA